MNKQWEKKFEKEFRLHSSAKLIDLCNKEDGTLGDINEFLETQLSFIQETLSKHESHIK